MSVLSDSATNSGSGYDLELCSPDDLAADDVKRCIALVADGGAVSPGTMKRDLPRSQILVIARLRNEIVGVGVIKPIRKQYSLGIAANSGYLFPPETAELGYVSVDRNHQGHGLSHKITELLVSRYPGRLFATTDSPRMKNTLADAGFQQQGREWPGERGMLSYWECHVRTDAPSTLRQVLD